MATLRKADIVDALANEKGISKLEARILIDYILGFIGDSLIKGDTVDIHDFGKFEVRCRASRAGINPATGEKIQLGESRNIYFKCKKNLKDRL